VTGVRSLTPHFSRGEEGVAGDLLCSVRLSKCSPALSRAGISYADLLLFAARVGSRSRFPGVLPKSVPLAATSEEKVIVGRHTVVGRCELAATSEEKVIVGRHTVVGRCERRQVARKR
jgi:hypothetical protein